MNAFETELGLMNELAKAVDSEGWLLPTDIQSEAIPLILGGGDVLMAAETGSGKTGAFCLPVLQIVYESLCEGPKGKGGARASDNQTKLSMTDRNESFDVDLTESGGLGLLCKSSNPKAWAGGRATRGVQHGAKAYFECVIKSDGICRVGWSLPSASLDLGTDAFGFGFGGTGKKSNLRNFETYGEPFTLGDKIGSYIDLSAGTISWSKNGKHLGVAYRIPASMLNESFYPTVSLKGCTVFLNFGAEHTKDSIVYQPQGGFTFVDQLPPEMLVSASKTAAEKKENKIKPNAPMCVVIEPSRELAEQTYHQFESFKRFLDSNQTGPHVENMLLIGGIPVKQQINQLRTSGAHIIVATPGRLEDLVSQRELELDRVRFLVLDELDGLLNAGYRDMLRRLHSGIPQHSTSGRLQMIVCSATLHNFDVKKLAEQLMHFPSWIDLKGQDSVPETVHHCVCMVDPVKDATWRRLPSQSLPPDDGVHRADRLNIQGGQTKETLSEGVKLLKPLYVARAIQKFKMDRCLVFCRTKLDCDNLERYFTQLGGGPRAPASHQFSCVCMHADRSVPERKSNLQAFKNSQVRIMICTDVAARGLDIAGLPFVINVTLPDEKSNYIHRIGRVGRAERMGLAISLCATVQEKVWYHTCPSRGRGCNDTRLTSEHGCCIWYTERMYLGEIEEHLGDTITTVEPDFNVPVDEFQGKVVYGQKLAQGAKKIYEGHADFLAPTVAELAKLERRSQNLFLELRQKIN